MRLEFTFRSLKDVSPSNLSENHKKISMAMKNLKMQDIFPPSEKIEGKTGLGCIVFLSYFCRSPVNLFICLTFNICAKTGYSTLGKNLRVYESGKGTKALWNCASNSVLPITYVATPYVNLPLGASPRCLQLKEAVDFTLTVFFTVCCILYAIIFKRNNNTVPCPC